MDIWDSYQLDGLCFTAQVQGFDSPAERRSVDFRAGSFNGYILSLLTAVIEGGRTAEGSNNQSDTGKQEMPVTAIGKKNQKPRSPRTEAGSACGAVPGTSEKSLSWEPPFYRSTSRFLRSKHSTVFVTSSLASERSI